MPIPALLRLPKTADRPEGGLCRIASRSCPDAPLASRSGESPNRLTALYAFYREGFRSMVLGRTLWKLIVLKLFLMFAVLKLFFFSNYLEKNFRSDQDRSAHVLENLTAGAPGASSKTQGGK